MQHLPRVGSIRFRREVRGRGCSLCTAFISLIAALAGSSARAQTLTVGASPSAIVYNPVTNEFYVGSAPVAVINGATNAVTTIAGTGYSTYYALNSVTNKIYYISGNNNQTLTAIDGATNTVTNIALGSVNASALAVNPVTNKIYVVTENNAGALCSVDGVTGAVTTLAVGTGNEGVVVNPVTNKIYVASGEARIVSVVDGVTNAITNVNVPSAAGFMAVNTTTNQIYLASDPIAVIDGASNGVTSLATPAGGSYITAFGYNPVTNNLYVATAVTGNNPADGTVTVINGFTGATTPITVGILPTAIAVNSVTNTIMVANLSSNNVTEINGATNVATTVAVGSEPYAIAVNPATNQFYVANGGGTTVSVVTAPAGAPVAPPAITLLPQSQSAGAGQSVTFTAAASGSPTYLWLLNGAAISGATNASLTLTNITAASAGTYTFVATNGGGSVTATATLAVSVPTLAAFTAQPVPQTVVSGTTVVFNSAANGTPAPTFQWKLNGTNVSGATSARLVISGATALNAGTYTCVATNSQGSTISSPAALTIVTTTSVGRLINLSVNTTAGASQVLTVGFVSGGSGTTGSESLLIRATGPALAAFGVPNTLADPTLTVLNGSTVLVANDNWGSTSANQAAVTAADNATGAFALANPASLDAAVAMPFAAGADTAQVSGNGPAVGTALAEIYDNTAAYTLATPRLINLSAKNQIAAKGSMTAGFVVGGSTAKTVLIRATGPALGLFGVPGTMPDPQLALHTTLANGQDSVLATNAGWGGDPQITAVSNSVGAFALTNAASTDSVVLVTLAPGAYTAVASSVSGAAGTVLIEVYEVP